MKSLPIYSLVGHAFVVLFLIATTAGASVSESLTGKVIGWPPIRNEREIGKLVSTNKEEEDMSNRQISGSCWNPVDKSLWVVQSNPQVVFKIQFDGESVDQEHATIVSYSSTADEINNELVQGMAGGDWNNYTWVNYADWEACAQLNPENVDELYVLSEGAGAIIRMRNLNQPGNPREYCVWQLSEKDIKGRPGMPKEVSDRDGADGFGYGTGAEGLEFLSNGNQTLEKREVRGVLDGRLEGYETNLYLKTFLPNEQGIDQEQERAWVQHNFADGDTEEAQLGQLAFVGHQREGRLYVFEINPMAEAGKSGQFINHGYFKTRANEICGLHWDAEGDDLYIWHGQELANPNHKGQRNSLEVWHLGRGPLTHPWGWKRAFEEVAFYDENVPGNKSNGVCTNYEGIALVGHNGTFGSGVHERTMFLVKDDGEASWETTPIRSFLLPHLPTVDLNHDGVVDQLDEAILVEAFRRNDMKFDLNGDGKLDQLDFAEVVAEELVEIEE